MVAVERGGLAMRFRDAGDVKRPADTNGHD